MVTTGKDTGKTDQVRVLQVPVIINLLLLALESNTEPFIHTHSRSFSS